MTDIMNQMRYGPAQLASACAMVIIAGSASAQVAPGPVIPLVNSAISPPPAVTRPLDEGNEDVTALQVSLYQRPPTLWQDNNFENLYRTPDGRFYRRAGATVAFFSGSQYVWYKGQQIALIPAGTVFNPAGIAEPDATGGTLPGSPEAQGVRYVGASGLASAPATQRASLRIDTRPVCEPATIPAAAVEGVRPGPRPAAAQASDTSKDQDVVATGAEEAERRTRLERLAREAIRVIEQPK